MVSFTVLACSVHNSSGAYYGHYSVITNDDDVMLLPGYHSEGSWGLTCMNVIVAHTCTFVGVF